VVRKALADVRETRRALDLCLFINGLPIATFELRLARAVNCTA